MPPPESPNWNADAEQLVRRAFEIAAMPEATAIKDEVEAGGTGDSRGFAFGLAAALCEYLRTQPG